MANVKFPEITVQLIGQDGNAFMILGLVTKALKQADVDPALVEQFEAEAMSGDYDNLLATVQQWVNVS